MTRQGGIHRVPPVVVIPVYNDWDACNTVLAQLDAALIAAGRRVRVVLVDDGSTQRWTPDHFRGTLQALRSIEVLTLRRNLGHQRAICVGLAVVDARYTGHPVLVMDGDGEDDPADAVRLLDEMESRPGDRVIFAERTRRSEGLLFRVSYALYRGVHRVLTGRRVRVGNFSAIPGSRVGALVVSPELWNHYAATVFVSRVPFDAIPTRRAQRISGHSSMNFVALVAHGLSAVTVFSEVVSVRVLLATLGMIALSGMGLLAVVGIRLFTELAIPGWASYTAGLLLIVMLLAIMFSFLFTFMVLFDRKNATMIPRRDHGLFVEGLIRVQPSGEPPSGGGDR